MFISLLSFDYEFEVNDQDLEVSEQASQASQVSSQISKADTEISLSCDSASEICNDASEKSISLALLEDDQSFESLKDLILKINEHAESRDYVIVMSRIKKFKLSVRRKTWLVCDRDRKSNESRDQDRRHIASRRIQCSFFVVVTREVDNDAWFLKIVNERHNHSAIFVDAHSAHRKLVMNEEMKSEIFKTLIVQIRSSQIIFALRVLDSMTDVNIENSENSRIVNSLFKSQDIYNVKRQLRRETLESLTSVQVNNLFSSPRVSLNIQDFDSSIRSRWLILRNAEERVESNNSFLFHQRNISENAENQLRSTDNELHVQDK